MQCRKRIDVALPTNGFHVKTGAVNVPRNPGFRTENRDCDLSSKNRRDLIKIVLYETFYEKYSFVIGRSS